MDDCTFCQIVREEAPAYEVHGNSEAKAFLSTGGAHPSHTLVVPVDHAGKLWQLSDDQVRAVFGLARDVADAQRRTLGVDGVNLAQANGYNQDIDHVHVHVVPKYEDDGKIHATDTGTGVVQGWNTESFGGEEREEAQKRLAEAFDRE